MVSTKKKKQHNKSLFSQLSECDADFVVGQSNHEAQTSNKTNAVDEGTSSNNITGPIHVNSPQVYMHTLEENIVRKVRGEVDNVMTTSKLEAKTRYWLR